MAETSQPQKGNLAERAFRKKYSALCDALAQPHVATRLANKLYSGEIITAETRDAIQTATPPTQQSYLLLQAVEKSIKIDYRRLRKFIRILRKQPVLEPISNQLRQCYRALVSEARLTDSGSDTDSNGQHQSQDPPKPKAAELTTPGEPMSDETEISGLNDSDSDEEYESATEYVHEEMESGAVIATETKIGCLQNEYEQLVIMTQEAVKAKSTTLNEFRTKITLRLPESVRSELETSLMKKLPFIYEAKSIDEIFGYLHFIWSYFNFGLLQHLVKVYGDDKLQQSMLKYTTSVESFRKQTTLEVFWKACPVAKKCLEMPTELRKKLKQIVFKHGNLKNLDDIERHRQELAQEYSFPDFTIILADIKKGSVATIWLAPPSLAAKLVNETKSGNVDFLKRHNILELKIQESIIYQSESAQTDRSVTEIGYSDLAFGVQLGHGASGVVYRGHWKSRDMDVAIKRVLGKINETEIEILNKLTHPSIVQFHGVVVDSPGPPEHYIITELAEGGSLYDLLHRKNYQPSQEERLQWAVQIAEGMKYLHQMKMMHRDLKSSNVLLTGEGNIKICDFGGAKYFDHTTKQTQAGTYRWMAPEMMKGEPVSLSSDVFNYGMLLYEIFVGKLPFHEAKTDTAVISKITNGELPPIPDSMEPHLAMILKQCWNANPKARPSFHEILETLTNRDEEALSNFLMKHGLTDQKWVSYFHEHNITKPDQILAVKGSVELYMALSSQEKAVLRKGLKIDDEICIPQSAIPLTDVQERKKQCEELFSMLGLTDFSPQKLTLRHALEIREDTLLTTKDFHQHRKETKTDPKNDDKDTSKGVQHTDPKLFPFFILQKIMAFDYKSRGKLICSSLATTESKRVSTEKMPDKYSALDGEDDDDNDDETMTLHPMDGLLALLHCSDNFLRQDLFSRLATCQLAIPLLMPDPFVPQITFPLWAMRSIVKEWECTQKSGRTISHEELLISYRAPLVSFMRFGTHNVSKSQILNSVISESKHDIFFHFNCDGGSAQQLLVSGLVEVCWYLPSDHIFPDVVSFANLHGDARRFSKQVSFLSKVSFMNFVFLNKEDLDSKAFQVLNELATAPGGLVVLQTKPTADNKTWHELSKSVPKEKFSIIKMTRMNEAEITDEVRSSINETLHEKWTAATGHRYTFEEFTSIAHNCNEEDSAKGEELAIKIVVDEEERDCAKGKELADHLKRIIHEFISAHPDRSPKELLPLQSSDLWHKWAFKHKEQYRQILRGHQGIEEYSAQQREEMNLIRSRQFHYVQHLTPLMKSFIQSILSHKGCVRKYFLHWLQLILDNVSRKQLPLLRSQYQEKRRELLSIRSKEKVNEKDEKRCRREIDELNSKMINSSFGLEHLLRETCQIYEAVRAGTQSSHRMFRLPAMAAELMIDGYPLELMDGDAAHVPMTWVSAVLDEVREKLIDPRVLVLSILGLQGTGKSTLMNTLFGLRFSVSAGRCTRGAFMQLLPIHPMLKHECKCDYLLIVDTEGLRAPELNYLQTQKHDNELATFIIGLANLTVINIFGETTGDLDDILQTAVHAFLRMKEVKLTCSCQFVHQNVPAVMAGEKGMMGRINFKEKLNQMTQAAAKEENLEEQYKNFRQIIEFDEEDDVYHFPGLWKGDPPMAPVNPGYSKKAQEMRLQLIKFAKAKPALPSGISASITRLTVFQAHIKELWKAILHENFVFSFKNTLEIDTLDAKYVQLSWSFQRQMMQWEQKAQNELKSCPRAELDEVYKRFVSVLPRHVREIYRSLKEDLETLFKESPEGEIMAKWKTKTEIRLSSLHDQLQTHAENHCKQISTSRRALAKADEMKASHRKRILKHVKELAAQLEQGTLNDEELEQRFNEQWIKWIAELRAIPVHLVDICVSFDVEKSLTEVFHAHNAMIIQKLTDRPLQKWGSPPKLKMVSQLYMQAIASSLKTTRFAKAIGFTWPGKCLHHAQKVTDDILEQVQKYLMEKQNDNYNPGLTNELLQILSKEINEFNSKATEFKFTSKFKVDIALTACGYALKKFELMVEAYRKKVDPVEYIEREIRESLLVLFKNQYFQVAQEKAAAVTLCDLLSKSVKKQVISSLSPRIVEDMRGNSQYFQSKPALKAKILLDIGEELNQNADFDHCALYLKDIKRSLQWWIKHYTTQHCKQGRLVQLGVIELSVLISCISQTAHEVTQDISPEQEEFSINDWLTKFHGKLQGRLEMDVTEFRDLVGAQQLKNVRNFNEEVRKGLRKLETKLQNEFLLSMDVSAMDQWETKPYDFIFKNLAGCTEQCPFCHEQCDLTNESHIPSTKHSVAMHRPRCLGGYRWTASGEMCLDICTALVGSDRVFRNHDTNNQDHPYKKYRDVYPQWIILDDKSAEISSYWKWLVGHYTSEVAQLFNMKEAEIPLEWKELSWHSVRKDLENMY